VLKNKHQGIKQCVQWNAFLLQLANYNNCSCFVRIYFSNGLAKNCKSFVSAETGVHKLYRSFAEFNRNNTGLCSSSNTSLSTKYFYNAHTKNKSVVDVTLENGQSRDSRKHLIDMQTL